MFRAVIGISYPSWICIKYNFTRALHRWCNL